MKQVQTVYDHIRRNNIHTLLLIFMFPTIFIALIFLFTCIVAPLSTAINTTISVAIPTIVTCMIWLTISWAFGDSMMLNMVNAQEINPNTPTHRVIYKRVENIALAAGLPTPRIYIIDSDALNAFATGRTPRDASVALTRGIINNLEPLELDGVIAHEMAHIGNRDIRLDMLLITGVGVTVFIADILGRNIMYGHSSSNNDNNNSHAILLMVWLAFMVFNFFVTPLLRMAISRNREYAADATGAHITRNPHALASALEKISKNSSIHSADKIQSMSSVFIASPNKKQAIGDLMSTHPPVSKRIERLKTMGLN